MNLRSPIVAMLWENWQLSRVEAGQRFGLGLVGGAGALMLSGNGATIAFWILVAVHAFFWFSISKLNGGKFADGYKPGFPLYLLFSRPVTTAKFVGVAMVYDAVSCTVLYLVSAALLSFLFGKPLPVFSMAVCLVTYHLACTCIQWGTRSRVAQWTGSIVVGWPFFVLLQQHVGSPPKVEFSLAVNAVMILIGVASLILGVVGIARQRRGDSVAIVPQQKEGTGGYPAWLISVFRFGCPTSSATRAQIWFELKSSGIPVLTIGLAVAIAISLLFALTIVFAPARDFAIGISMFSVPVLLFLLGGNVFGIRRKQGKMYASAFEATQPYGTAKLAGLKLLVRSACVLAALTAIGISVWVSSSWLGGWKPWFVDGKNAVDGLIKIRSIIAGNFGELPGYAYATLAVFAFFASASFIAWQSAREALKARYARVMMVVNFLPVVWGFAILLLALAKRSDIAPALPIDTILQASFWAGILAVLIATIYLFWTGVASGVLTARYLSGAVSITAVSGAAWLATLLALGAPLAQMHGSAIAAILFPVLLIFMNSVLAPWSLDRARHA